MLKKRESVSPPTILGIYERPHGTLSEFTTMTYYTTTETLCQVKNERGLFVQRPQSGTPRHLNGVPTFLSIRAEGSLILYSHPMTRIRSHSFHLSWGEPTHGVYGIYSIYTSGSLLSNSDHTLYYHTVQGLSSKKYSGNRKQAVTRVVLICAVIRSDGHFPIKVLRTVFQDTLAVIFQMLSIPFNHSTYTVYTRVKGMSSAFCTFFDIFLRFVREILRVGRL